MRRASKTWIFSIALFGIGILLTYLASRLAKGGTAVEAPAGQAAQA